MATTKKSVGSKEPDYKIGDKLEFLKGDGETITAKIVAVYPTAVPSYKLESEDTPMPMYLSEPVLKKCLANPPKEIEQPEQDSERST